MHKITQRTAMLALMSLFIIGPAVALAETIEQTNDISEPQQQTQSGSSSFNKVMPNQSHHRMMENNLGNASTFMFNGITLNEEQRQQMRDLMAVQWRNRSDNSNLVQDREVMHRLVTADTFDENAVRAEIEKQLQKEVQHRVEMARVHHELYLMLTPEQKAQLERQYLN